MKKLFYIFIVLSWFTIAELQACICNTIPFEVEYRSSDIIFIGYVIDSDENSYVMVVSEYLKGYGSDTLRGFVDDSCSNLPLEGETWLYYGNFNEDQISSTNCGSSRPFHSPHSSNGYNTGPPPKEMSMSQYYISGNLITNIELLELQFEINTMRYRNLTQKMEQFKNLDQEKDSRLEGGNYLLYLLLGLIVLMNLRLLLR